MKKLWLTFLILSLVPFLLYWMKAEANEAIVINPEYQWTYDDEIGRLIWEAELPAIVAEVKHTENKWPKYTVKVGLGGARKPIPAITGLSTDERAKEWLETAWLGYTLPTWKELWEKYKIDYTLPICIAWADSHLGKALKSKNNIGNVWNDDRGRTREYETLEAWIEAIFWHLAKWKYMSGHNTIWTLSGEGRKRLWLPWCAEEKDYRKKCYASSMGVWSTNVTNCMSAIHDRKIDENFEFRTQ